MTPFFEITGPMEPLHFLRELLIVFAVAGAVVFLFHRLRVPTVVGLLVAGVLTGPHGLGLIADTETVVTLAEIGVVVLLFAVGLEFSLPRLVGLGRLMLLVGVPQVASCVVVGAGAGHLMFADARLAALLGMMLAMSSTAVVFKILTDRGEMGSAQGNIAAAVLLFQDLVVVVCMALLPLLAARDGEASMPWRSLGFGSIVIGLLLVAGRYVVPFVVFQVVRTKNRELFLIVLVLACLGGAALTESMGWSLALGAFLAGLILSESEYAAETLAEVLPFRDTLASLFFISVGMLLDLRFVASHVPLIGALAVVVVTLKFAAAALPTRKLAGYPPRIAVLLGASLAQIGEFSFILADRGLALGILDRDQQQAFLATAVVSITLTPALIGLATRFAARAAGTSTEGDGRAGRDGAEAEDTVTARGHVVVLGYGLNGRNLARVLRAADIEYVVLELNPETVRKAAQANEPVHYGDGTRPAVLEHLNIRAARLLVVAISDPISSRRIVQLARHMNPALRIIARTRYLAEVPELRALGADTIIPEEFETSVEIFARVLAEYDVPANLIMELVERIRSDHYEVLRDRNVSSMRIVLPDPRIPEMMEIKSCWIRGGSPADGRSLRELNLRSLTGATVLAVRRGREMFVNPEPDLRIAADDIAVLAGDPAQVDRAMEFLDAVG